MASPVIAYRQYRAAPPQDWTVTALRTLDQNARIVTRGNLVYHVHHFHDGYTFFSTDAHNPTSYRDMGAFSAVAWLNDHDARRLDA